MYDQTQDSGAVFSLLYWQLYYIKEELSVVRLILATSEKLLLLMCMMQNMLWYSITKKKTNVDLVKPKKDHDISGYSKNCIRHLVLQPCRKFEKNQVEPNSTSSFSAFWNWRESSGGPQQDRHWKVMIIIFAYTSTAKQSKATTFVVYQDIYIISSSAICNDAKQWEQTHCL
jgi:hypothetical protein